MKHNKTSDFGGDWTEKKLNALKKYMDVYTTSLKNQPFELCYIDAFAGSGLAHGNALKEEKEYKEGSPLIALSIEEKSFDSFCFIEKEKSNLDKLKKKIKEKYPEKDSKCDFICEDANNFLEKLLSNKWTGKRGICFLDPFATELKCSTLGAIANTEALDIWILFPVMAVNRMLKKDGEIKDSHKKKLNELFGNEDWEEKMYVLDPQTSLFEEQNKKKEYYKKLAEVFIERLKEIFPAVLDKPIILKNSRNTILFCLCFAVSNRNKKGQELAFKIAQHIVNSSDE